jgi:hypothetical protein
MARAPRGLVLIAFAAIAGACGTHDGPRPLATTAAIVSAPPASPAATDAGSELGVVVPGDAIRVEANEVTFHADAAEASSVVGEAARDDILIVIDIARVDGAGHLWISGYEAHSPVPGRLPNLPQALPEPEFALTGWIEVGDAAGPTVARIPPRCPAADDLSTVSAMLGSERVACFGNRSLSFDALAGCAPCGGDDGVYQPAWLAGNAGGSIDDRGTGGNGQLALYFPPPLVAPSAGSDLRVRGHFDDSRAGDCQMSIDGVAWPQGVVVELCRRHFVVEAVQVLPTPTQNPLE